MHRGVAWILCLVCAWAEAPRRIPFECTAEDVAESGLTCSAEQPCEVYLELSGVETALNRVFVAGNLHTADATLYSVLLASEDGGKTWAEPYPRTRFAALEEIQFIDFENGWVAGSYVLGVPHDPFLLITNDGGKSWHEQRVFEENRAGVIEHFWFDSLKSGKIWIDTNLKHELYETRTGGDSWEVRQSGKAAIPFTGGHAAADAAVRLRPDAKTHAIHVEKRQGDKWVGLVEFSVDAGKCIN
jgi:photosystem II stability/assembly factor-like uncharacterized protein